MCRFGGREVKAKYQEHLEHSKPEPVPRFAVSIRRVAEAPAQRASRNPATRTGVSSQPDAERKVMHVSTKVTNYLLGKSKRPRVMTPFAACWRRTVLRCGRTWRLVWRSRCLAPCWRRRRATRSSPSRCSPRPKVATHGPRPPPAHVRNTLTPASQCWAPTVLASLAGLRATTGIRWPVRTTRRQATNGSPSRETCRRRGAPASSSEHPGTRSACCGPAPSRARCACTGRGRRPRGPST